MKSKTPPLDSLDLVRHALRHQGLTPTQRCVLAEIASHDPDSFVIHFGTLTEWVYGANDRRKRDQLKKMLLSLEDLGVLRIEWDDRGTPTKYEVVLPDVARTSPRRLTRKNATLPERRVTLAERHSDVAGTSPSNKSKKNNTKRSMKDSKTGDVGATSLDDELWFTRRERGL